MPLATVGSRKVYYEVHGEETKQPPLVLVMGLAGSCSGWLALQVPEFAPHHRVVIFDNRGVGESEDPGGPFTTADLADDLVGLLDALSIEKANLLGAFMGGMALQELAIRHPERANRLIMVGTWSRPDAKRRLLLEKWQAMARAGTTAEIFTRERMLWTLQDETLEQRDLVEAMSAASFPGAGLPVDADLFVRQCQACLDHDSHDRLHQIEHKTLLVCGRNDQLTPPKLHRLIADEIPGARLATMPYGAHLVMAESAERFHETVLDFLR